MDLPRGQGYARATEEALSHALVQVGGAMSVRVVPTAAIDEALITSPGAGVVVGPGSPYGNPEGVLAVIRSARERGVPLVGT